MYDVTIIGAGVVGAFIARELSRYQIKVCLVEKEADVANGSTKANSAIIHAGYDARNGSLKGILNVRGNQIMGQVAEELGVPFKRIGSLVLAFNENDLASINNLFENGVKNKVPELQLLSAKEVSLLEPNLSKEVVGALLAPTAGIICPYELTIGAVENAVLNGVELKLETRVDDIKQGEESFTVITENGEINTRFIINASGINGDIISAMVGEKDFVINPRKGEYLLLDKSQGNLVSKVIFQTPSEMGKGILVTTTVDGNLLIGPTAINTQEREDHNTTDLGMKQVIDGAKKSVPLIQTKDVITSFAGLRATPSTGDFVIAASKRAKGFINAAGIESPGLSAAPAIAEYVIEITKKEGLILIPKESFNPIRKPIVRFKELSDGEKNQLIKENPMYGNVVCRCEMITEGEIVDCINRPAGAKNLDAVKRRTRSGMGRCQGGFCTPRIVFILSRELHIPVDEITKKGRNSRLLLGKTM